MYKRQARRVRKGCFTHNRADCEAGATVANKSARTPGERMIFMKRMDYISWDEYFMGVALLAARRSKDPNTQVCLLYTSYYY